MSKIAISTALAVMVAAASEASAGSWSVGVGIGYGPPVYYGPPPVYYEPPIYYEPAPPPVYYYQPPPVLVPVEPPVVLQMQAPGDVLEALERAGYRELGPMAHRGALYALSAVNPEGELVALEISVYTGEIERELILQSRPTAAPRQVMQPPPQPSGSARDPLVVY